MSMENRCACAMKEEMWAYHDEEWGVPVHDDRTHFEFLVLEGGQAGLSWSTILKGRVAGPNCHPSPRLEASDLVRELELARSTCAAALSFPGPISFSLQP